ncbi:glycosyltransferase family 4 protein [Priestia megaterium]|uniref:glycosyltransferase family 4 protein n=1 Tax=Priestia megaterium TaxID=1404 RepID=UPI000E2FB9C7|nr:glycosyltransferase family 4 protein [Priestia megaterium]MDF2013705.1 glycosyltransferase family 4 protein [Priestia megaterium]RFB39721.1 glycosyltransferase [Bacillus sp. RC]
MNRKKKICFIAQFPPPIHGLSKAVDTLYNSNLSEEFNFEKIDIKDNKKIVGNLTKIWKSKANLFYFTLSQTRGGNIRDLIILKFLSMMKKKCVIHLHGGYYRKLIDENLPTWQRKLNYEAIKKLAGVIVLSPILKSIFQGMIEEEKIFIVSNCIDQEFMMSQPEFEKKINQLNQKKELNVLYLSNFIKSKGYDKVLEMAKYEKERAMQQNKKCLHFNFAGNFFHRNDQEFFEQYIKENGLHDLITYHGVVSSQSKIDLLQKCDIFVLLTNYPNEGQPIAILEAMGNAMVIVTTNHAGIPDIVQDERNGILLSTENITISNLLNRIDKVFGNEEAAEIMINNRNSIKEKYTEGQYLKNMARIFKKLT